MYLIIDSCNAVLSLCVCACEFELFADSLCSSALFCGACCLMVLTMITCQTFNPHNVMLFVPLPVSFCSCRNIAQLPAEAPRLLTAEEEAALGSVVQQYRKLVQLHRDKPDVAAALDPPAEQLSGHAASLPELQQQLDAAASHAGLTFSTSFPASSSSSISRPASPAGMAAFLFSSDSSCSDEESSPSSSRSSSRRSSTSSKGPMLGPNGKRVHGNVKWPPPLSEADVQEVCGMSRAWRAMLPELAAKAQQLLVLYNTR
jgi:hypothetical protein